jgi:hypothetical protein
MVRYIAKAIIQSSKLVIWPCMDIVVHTNGHLFISDLEITGIEEQGYINEIFLFSVIT